MLHLLLILALLAAGAALSLVLTPFVIRHATRRGMVDAPAAGRRIHAQPVPRVGGVAVFSSVAIVLAIAATAAVMTDRLPAADLRLLLGITLGAGLLFAIGLLDDLRELRPGTKLLAQCVAAAVAYAFGARIQHVGFGIQTQWPLALGALSLPLTLFWIVGVTNAYNLIDGLDGLATGIALIALVTIGGVSLLLGNYAVAAACAVMMGALLGFLRYNFSPARIFLGDSGSMFVGFMLAVLAVRGSVKAATAVLAIIPLFALALPLLDTSLAILRRSLRGTALSGADARHIHHQLLSLGLTQRRVVSILYLIASTTAAFGVSLAFSPPVAVIWVAGAGGAASVLLLLYGMRQLQYHEFVEVGGSLVSLVRKARRVLRDRIHAQDLVQVIRIARTRQEIDAILEDNTAAFGFVQMECCPWDAPLAAELRGTRAWRLDYPVHAAALDDADEHLVLRICCTETAGIRRYGAERVARILAPALAERIAHVTTQPRRVPGAVTGRESAGRQVALSA